MACDGSAIAELAKSRLSRLFLRILLLFVLATIYLSILGLPNFHVNSESDPLGIFRFHVNSSENEIPLCCRLLSERGTTLLHTLGDEELLDLATKNSTRSKCPYVTCRSDSSKPKIAVMFLTTGPVLPLASLWEQFFKGNRELFSIYVHSNPFFLDTTFNRSNPFWGRLIPSQKATYDTPSLSAAVRRLLANAFIDDPSNQFFALISETNIPLHGFAKVYHTIMSSNCTFMHLSDHFPSREYKYNARGKDVMLPEVTLEDFCKASLHSVFSRKHAELIVGDKKIWSKFKLECLYPSCFPDEHYFPTLINLFDPSGTTSYTLTFVDWSQSTDSHPRSFKPEELNVAFFKHLQQLDGGRYMFARKFLSPCLPSLLNLTHVILD